MTIIIYYYYYIIIKKTNIVLNYIWLLLLLQLLFLLLLPVDSLNFNASMIDQGFGERAQIAKATWPQTQRLKNSPHDLGIHWICRMVYLEHPKKKRWQNMPATKTTDDFEPLQSFV